MENKITASAILYRFLSTSSHVKHERKCIHEFYVSSFFSFLFYNLQSSHERKMQEGDQASPKQMTGKKKERKKHGIGEE